jgi:hypothetical protein
MGRNSGRRKIEARHAGETSAGDICLRILKLLAEDHERGIAKGAGICAEPDRNIRKDQQR